MTIKQILIDAEEDLLSAAEAGWDVVVASLQDLEEEALDDLKALFNEAVQDLEAGFPVDQIVTKVLNLAESKGWSWIVDLETSVLRGLAGLLGAKAV